jgi:hypothetical protein
MLLILAQEVSTQDVKEGYGSLIFMGCFFLAAIAVAIWWLKRQS